MLPSCRICGRDRSSGFISLNTIDIPETEDGGGSRYTVCSSCWEIIAEISKRVAFSLVIPRIEEISRQLNICDNDIEDIAENIKIIRREM